VAGSSGLTRAEIKIQMHFLKCSRTRQHRETELLSLASNRVAIDCILLQTSQVAATRRMKTGWTDEICWRCWLRHLYENTSSAAQQPGWRDPTETHCRASARKGKTTTLPVALCQLLDLQATPIQWLCYQIGDFLRFDVDHEAREQWELVGLRGSSS
jgi:hypothetical protein